ncbi:MAG TPA: Gmad2 immunoglobulin-like domain-containing protein [Armatimonadota bacterium]|nr:Gmad2 immunoglobulin-like domain-containing protein [Armatimonadota bacterium]
MTKVFIGFMIIALLRGCSSEVKETESRSASGNIIVTEPDVDEAISSPVLVAGKARVFEAALTVRVLTEDGRELARANIMASQGAPEFGDFSVQVSFEKPSGVSKGFVEAYSESAKDGSPINVVRVPVRFK